MGSPLRSPQELESIDRVCEGCKFYWAANRVCQVENCCGDSVQVGRQILENKQHMGTEACPAGQWWGLPGQLIIKGT